ncbi:hypothetical protein [Massilia sp. Se16.2.3]|uniref:hypothetical protein n=1 Tax=Massilia sp. Se16.2.3 TaxID=2709303 RepID=UPI002804F096|nr:hypothetical protein [Massilia sp. Se16.2.3]
MSMNSVPEDALPPYAGIAMADVRLVKSGEDAAAALAALSQADVIGFDTESKPTFAKGEESTGPHRCSWQRTTPPGCSRSAPTPPRR